MKESILKELANVLSIKDYDSKEQLASAIDSDGNPATMNSGPKFDWDVRYSKIRGIGIRNGMKALTINRGHLWDLVALLDEKHEEISLFLSEKNLQRILKEQKPTHYVPIFSFLNIEESLQTSLDVGDNQHSELTEKLFMEMMNKYEITAKKTYVYTFSDTYGQEQFMMYRFTSDYELIEHKNYSSLIDSTFGDQTPGKVKTDTKDTTLPNRLKNQGDQGDQEDQEKQIVSLKNN